MLDRLTEVGWVQQCAVTDEKLHVVWTKAGEDGMASLATYFFRIEYLSDTQKEQLMYLLERFYPRADEHAPKGDNPDAR